MIGGVSVGRAALGKAGMMLVVAEHCFLLHEDDGRSTIHDE